MAVVAMGEAAGQAVTVPPEAAVVTASPTAKPEASAAERSFFDPVPVEERRWFYDCAKAEGWLARQCRGFRDAWYERRPMLILSGYSWHDPATYDEEKLDSYNSEAWGGGFGLGLYEDTKGDHFSWYVLAFKDSNYNWTKILGFAGVTYWPEKADIAVGLGYTVFIMQRPDIYSGIPFPAALPLGSLKLGKAEILATFIPKLDAGVNHGNVGYFFGRYQF